MFPLRTHGPCGGRVSRNEEAAARVLAPATALAVLFAAGCAGTRVKQPFDAPAAEAAAKPHKLRYKRPAGTADRYQAKYDVRVRQKETGGKAHAAGFQRLRRDGFESDEQATAEVVVYYTGETGNGRFDRVVFHRRNVTRDLVEIAPNGTVKPSKKPGPPFQPRITPNFEADPRTRDLYYIPMNELGVIACRKETPFHYAWYDSLCYMFPIFPKEEVRVGERWFQKVPVVVGLQHSENVMNLNTTFTFSDLRRIPDGGEEEEGSLCAVTEHTYYAIFDTRHPVDAGKLPPDAPAVVWRRFVVEGGGKAYFDIEAGKVLWRSEEYTILLEHAYDRPARTPEEDRARRREREREKKKKKDEPPELERMHYSAVNTVKFSARLLAPGERADERPSRQDR